MKQIVLVAETGSDINPVLAAEYNIKIVPMHVSFDHETMEDGAFPVEKIVDYYEETGKLPKTSGSTPGDFETAFDRIHAEYPDAQLLYLAYSAVTTCSMQSAVLAAEERDYAAAFAAMPKISWVGHCMYCGHCAPCPVGIDVASVTKFLNLVQAQGDVPETVREHYAVLPHHAGECLSCGACEKRCPFGVPVMENMGRAKEIFGK